MYKKKILDMKLIYFLLVALILLPHNAYAYIEPSFVASFLASIFIALNFLLLYFLGFIKKIKKLTRKIILYFKRNKK